MAYSGMAAVKQHERKHRVESNQSSASSASYQSVAISIKRHQWRKATSV